MNTEIETLSDGLTYPQADAEHQNETAAKPRFTRAEVLALFVQPMNDLLFQAATTEMPCPCRRNVAASPACHQRSTSEATTKMSPSSVASVTSSTLPR